MPVHVAKVRARHLGLVGLAVLVVALGIAFKSARPATAASGLEIALQDDAVFLEGKWFDRERALRIARGLGVTRLRVGLGWAFTLPRAQQRARQAPANPSYSFAAWDALIDAAARYGIRVHLSIQGPAPAFATGDRRVGPYKPNAREFERFVRVVAQHFKGRVDRYSLWNEPNWATWLAPLRAAPSLYRALYQAGWQAIKSIDPQARVLFGETAPYARPGLSIAPLDFLRRTLCVDRKYRPVRKRCPALRADGYAHHPYDFAHSPDYRYPGADNVTMGTLSRLTRALDTLARRGRLLPAGASRMPLYLTEFGYFSSGRRMLRSSKARERYTYRSFDIALRNPRVRSHLYYLLVSPPSRSRWAFFDLGLLDQRGRGRPQYTAIRKWYKRNRTRVRQPGPPLTFPLSP